MSIETNPRPLIVTGDSGLLADLQRLCAAASVTPEVIADPSQARRSWASASCVLVGDDCSATLAALAMGRRDDVVLVSNQPETAGVWQRGVAIRADSVTLLPEGQRMLVDRLTDSADGSVGRAVTVGVVGACGGAGASTLAATLGLVAARRGDVSLLVDADPLAGGIELVVGCEAELGLRWPEVATTHGRVSAVALRAALPSRDGLAVLSCARRDQEALSSPAIRAMLVAGQRGNDVVVVDLPRRRDDWVTEVVGTLDVLLLVSPLEVRAAAAAVQLLQSWRTSCPDIRLVVRLRTGDPLEPAALSTALGLPIVAELPTQRSLRRAVDDGLGPIVRGRALRSYEVLLDAIGVTSSGRAR